MKTTPIAATACAAALLMSGASFAHAPKDNLADAIVEAQSYGGGTVLQVNENQPDAPQRFSAVVEDSNGVLNHFSYNLPVGNLWPARPVSTAQFSHALTEMPSAKVLMPDAVRAAEQATGGTAVAAAFVSAPHAHVIGYKIQVANGAGPAQTVVIDAKTGAPIPNADRFDLRS